MCECFACYVSWRRCSLDLIWYSQACRCCNSGWNFSFTEKFLRHLLVLSGVSSLSFEYRNQAHYCSQRCFSFPSLRKEYYLSNLFRIEDFPLSWHVSNLSLALAKGSTEVHIGSLLGLWGTRPSYSSNSYYQILSLISPKYCSTHFEILLCMTLVQTMQR